MEIVEETGSKWICNECSAIVSQEDVARLILQMGSCDATCPHCGKVDRIKGFSEVCAFRCQYCGRA